MLNAVAASVGTDAALGLWARVEVPFTNGGRRRFRRIPPTLDRDRASIR